MARQSIKISSWRTPASSAVRAIGPGPLPPPRRTRRSCFRASSPAAGRGRSRRQSRSCWAGCRPSVVLQEHFHDVLADVVDIPLDRGQQDGPPLPRSPGESNVSHGLPGRDALNCAFLSACLAAGLNMPIVNTGSPAVRDALDGARALMGEDPGCAAYIARHSGVRDILGRGGHEGREAHQRGPGLQGRRHDGWGRAMRRGRCFCPS